MKQLPVSSETVIKWTGQLLHAIAHVHNHRYIHRDVKIENILVTKEDDLILCDFGMARHFPCSGFPISPDVCSLWTRAPEVKSNNKFYDDKIDSWSVGCCILSFAFGYEILNPTNFEKLFLDGKLSLDNLSVTKKLPHEYYLVISQLLNKNPKDRCHTKDIYSLFDFQTENKKVTLNNVYGLLSSCELKLTDKCNIQEISTWLKDLSFTLGIHESTLQISIKNWIRYGNETPVSAISCLSLSTKLNETKKFHPSIWSKAVGKSVQNIMEAEEYIMKVSAGKLSC
jgi:serine/threonine protein kinase